MYLTPSTLIPIYIAAYYRGELKLMWTGYYDDELDDEEEVDDDDNDYEE